MADICENCIPTDDKIETSASVFTHVAGVSTLIADLTFGRGFIRAYLMVKHRAIYKNAQSYRLVHSQGKSCSVLCSDNRHPYPEKEYRGSGDN